MVRAGVKPPPEAELIRSRREAAAPAVSRRQAAALAGISPSQWSDVERGHKQAGSGITVPVVATPETLARMACIIGVSAEDLATAGRDDAARELRAVEQERRQRQRLASIPGIGLIEASPLPGADDQELLSVLASAMDQIEQSPLPQAVKRDVTALFVSNLTHDAARRLAELTLILRIAGSTSIPAAPVSTLTRD